MCADVVPTAAAMIAVEVVYAAAPHQIERVALRLPAGATAREALCASGLAERLDAALLGSLVLGLAALAASLRVVVRVDMGSRWWGRRSQTRAAPRIQAIV